MQARTFNRVAALVLMAAVSSGCSWFHKDSKLYAKNPESRPLEVPPDLDRPGLEAAAKLPATASAMAPAAAASPVGFVVPGGNRDSVFAKVGEALGAMEGVNIASRAQLLGAYDVSYAGANFLVRVTAVEAGVQVAAVDPRGQPATGDAPARLMASLKAAIGS